ncbi:hypothetical protein FOZ63_032408 [Perkinsus olseni]|uniref:Uncharacterized protein n=1 Tax=Perkinsus olseni TaxID=32597 RepID=A0A7J6UP39_PEROL|nr:hypothetical protein FOZ63_032408 [Perkinsus olseni]
MPYGITIKQFVVSTSMAFSSLLMGSIVVHAIMQPSLQQPDFTDEVEARQRAIRRVQEEELIRNTGSPSSPP